MVLQNEKPGDRNADKFGMMLGHKTHVTVFLKGVEFLKCKQTYSNRVQCLFQIQVGSLRLHWLQRMNGQRFCFTSCNQLILVWYI